MWSMISYLRAKKRANAEGCPSCKNSLCWWLENAKEKAKIIRKKSGSNNPALSLWPECLIERSGGGSYTFVNIIVN